MTDRPHPLELYRLSVQHPLAEVSFIERAWAHYHRPPAPEPLLLREDFAGTCATAAAWVRSDPERQAMAVELDGPTLAWAERQAMGCPRCEDDLHQVQADVMQVDAPATDVTLALNFSTLIYHDQSALLAYLRHAHDALAPGGLLILDLFGIDEAHPTGSQSRLIQPDGPAPEPFTYTWEQRSFDPGSRRIDCRIHFTLADGTRLTDAFCYDWRLWKMDSILSLMHQAGFATAQAWGPTAEHGDTAPPGQFSVLDQEPTDREWVIYLVGKKA